jgi:hypothetical protein
MRPMMWMTLALAAGALSACGASVDAPMDRGVCWHMVKPAKGKIKFNVLARNQPNLEHCAAELEKMRLTFRALGVDSPQVIGAYQGQFLFLEREGVFTAQGLDAYQYPFMVRTGDGRLAMPGAMPQQEEQK